MRITADCLCEANACDEQVNEFKKLFPNGARPTVENISIAENADLDVFWISRLLPAEGYESERAFSLWCAERVMHLNKDKRVNDCIKVIRRRIDDYQSVGKSDLSLAARAAEDAAAESFYMAVKNNIDPTWNTAALAAKTVACATLRHGKDVALIARTTIWSIDADSAAWHVEREAQLAYLSQLLMKAKSYLKRSEACKFYL